MADCASQEMIAQATSIFPKFYNVINFTIFTSTVILTVFAVKELILRSIFHNSTRVIFFFSLFFANLHEFVHIQDQNDCHDLPDSLLKNVQWDRDLLGYASDYRKHYGASDYPLRGPIFGLSSILLKSRFSIALRYQARESLISTEAVCRITTAQFFALTFYAVAVLLMRINRDKFTFYSYANTIFWVYAIPYAAVSLPLLILLTMRITGKGRRKAINIITQTLETQDGRMKTLKDMWDRPTTSYGPYGVP
ncbi:unnamed protein product [Caenorhabditis auriculariae]|uniref:Uncharacterized protein n=1 Tax=Caenorhabditis auriculariae TaxID=2777116 RepID=A0A8S1H1E9_9PELO|nr:unnamed protein product [Caenorhabditis auriculariae]